ncbi:MAG TPA: hypothetical protein P5026_13800 [Kiritimatiellia bacterium]|nr:hypothetical protein [Kiritimatiellia bacterium]HRR35171.1 hypothetical protein [Kiritimatiellia bacterium]HRU71777.1 hypothetical protein [Kiritimatiellia bacterium]
MAKHKNKQEEIAPTPPADQPSDAVDGTDEGGVPVAQETQPEQRGAPTAEEPCDNPARTVSDTRVATPSVAAARPARWRRWLPDLIKVALALVVIAVAAAIWYQPPLVQARFPYVSYVFYGQRYEDATLFRPLAMPTRYYVALPELLADRYQWFAVDRRREVVALTEAPRHRVLGRPAIRRSDPLGLDLEFRKLDGSEWQIAFLDDAIVFSNALLTVRLDTRQSTPRP